MIWNKASPNYAIFNYSSVFIFFIWPTGVTIVSFIGRSAIEELNNIKLSVKH
jgi:hypothetical protein